MIEFIFEDDINSNDKKEVDSSKKTVYKDMITITFGDQAENHVGMEKIGKLADKGYNIKELYDISSLFKNKGLQCELIDLTKVKVFNQKEQEEINKNEAVILIVRNGVKALLGNKNIEDLYKEEKNLKWDTKAYMRGRVVNKHARYNLCYDEQSRKADYENKKGTIISYEDVPLLKKVKNNLNKYFRDKAKDLKAEGNYYYNLTHCGIGFHGDGERKIVIAIRLGYNFPLYFKWYHNSKPISETIEIKLNHGDVYIMSEKAVGTDWRKRSLYTLRHATGSSKFVNN